MVSCFVSFHHIVYTTLTTFGLAMKEFVIECMTLAGEAGGPVSPSSSGSTLSHLSAPTLVSLSQE